MKLFYTPATGALACWIALEWAGLDYEVEAVEAPLSRHQMTKPLALVPIADHRGSRCMTQPGAVLRYIANRSGQPSLGAEPGVDAGLEFDEAMFFLSGDFHPAFRAWFSPRCFTERRDTESLTSVRTAALARVDRVLTQLDRLIGETGHVHRGKRTVADAYAFAMTRWAGNLPKTWRDYPNLTQFMDESLTDDTVRKVLRATGGRG